MGIPLLKNTLVLLNLINVKLFHHKKPTPQQAIQALGLELEEGKGLLFEEISEIVGNVVSS